MSVYYILPTTCSPERQVRRLPMVTRLTLKTRLKMEKNTIAIRLSDEQYGWLRALSRRSKRSQSEVVRSLIEQGTVRERITRENLDII